MNNGLFLGISIRPSTFTCICGDLHQWILKPTSSIVTVVDTGSYTQTFSQSAQKTSDNSILNMEFLPFKREHAKPLHRVKPTKSFPPKNVSTCPKCQSLDRHRAFKNLRTSTRGLKRDSVTLFGTNTGSKPFSKGPPLGDPNKEPKRMLSGMRTCSTAYQSQRPNDTYIYLQCLVGFCLGLSTV